MGVLNTLLVTGVCEEPRHEAGLSGNGSSSPEAGPSENGSYFHATGKGSNARAAAYIAWREYFSPIVVLTPSMHSR